MENPTFQTLGLNQSIIKATNKLFFKSPTNIQEKAIPEILSGNNVIGQSETGSGKTHAYLLPLLNEIDESKNEVQIVITAPTRELAIQIHEEIKLLTIYTGKEDVWRTRLVIGGTDRERMMKKLNDPPHIIVGTPGRIADMVHTGVVSIYSATAFVIDEADLMVEMKFMENIDELLVRCNKDIQLLVFSATIPQALKIFFKKYLRQAVHLDMNQGITPEKITHHLIALKHQNAADKVMALSNVIQPYVAILFVNSKEYANELGETLKMNGLNVGILHGGLKNRERTRITKAIFDHQFEYIVATDLASRGIDIKGASHVINVEMPKEVNFYIHRIGRTARAGLEGMAISFYQEEDIPLIESLEQKGITFQYSEVKNNELIPVKRYNERYVRKDITTELDKEAWKRVKKPKKVKPGYKKKMKHEQEKVKRQLKKQHKRNK